MMFVFRVFNQIMQISNIFPKSILFFIPLLITSCVGGATTIKASDGSSITFKSENVICKNMQNYVWCTANGVRTLLNGYKTNFSQRKLCQVINPKGVAKDTIQSDQFACIAAKKLKKLR